MSLFRFKRIKNRFSIPVLIGAILILTLSTTFYYFYETHQIKSQVQQQGQELLNFAELANRISLWEYDYQNIMANGESLLANKNVSKITFKDSFDKTLLELSETGPEHASTYLKKFSRKVYYKNEIAGEIELTLTSYYLQQDLLKRLQFNMIQAALILVFLIVIIRFVAHSISRSLENILSQATAIVKGDLSTQIKIESSDEIGQLSKHFNSLLLESKSMGTKMEQMIQLTAELVDSALNKDDQFLSKVLHIALSLVPEADCGSISVIEGEDWRFVDAKGHDIEKLKRIPLKRSYAILQTDHESKQVNGILETNEAQIPTEIQKKLLAASKPIQSTILVELNFQNQCAGFLAIDISKNRQASFAPEAKKTLSSFGSLASAFLAIRRYSIMQETFQKEVILSMINILELHDIYTRGHSENVATWSVMIARKLGLSLETQDKVYWSGLVHDIGKILLPTEILNKKEPLTDEEFALIKQHPEWGYRVLAESDELSETAKDILHHHERWDGRGYPLGLQGKEIPLTSRIISVADAYDAMTSNRAYRKALSREIAVAELKKNSGTQFDPEIVEVFLKAIS